ncbi:MAG TPA: hypothetical protein VIK91_03760 [Nannocystis sp.]
MTKRSPSTVATVLVLATACASAPVELPAPDRRLAAIGNLGTHSNFEIRTLYAVQDPAPAQPPRDEPRARKRPVTPILFYLGVTVAALAGGAAIGTAAASYGLRRKLDGNYFEDGFTYDEYNRTVDHGNRLSKASWGLGFTAVSFAAMALIAYSVDWSRCGPLAPKRRRDTAPPGRCEEFHPDHKTEPLVAAPPPAPTTPPPGPAPAPAAPEGPAPAGN